jgi:rhodanese-related sulfurtransferase
LKRQVDWLVSGSLTGPIFSRALNQLTQLEMFPARDKDWPVNEQRLATARARLRRLSPYEAYESLAKMGTILVDIRSESQRAIEGSIPGALIVEPNVLEWRLDPASSARLPVATDHDLQVIVFCSEGYTSSLAATALQDLGLWRATDMVGGFHAWSAAGLLISVKENRDVR